MIFTTLLGSAWAVTFSLESLPLGAVPVDLAVQDGTIYIAGEVGWELSDGYMVTPGDAATAPAVYAAAVAIGASGLYLCNEDGLWSFARGVTSQLTTTACVGLTASDDAVLFDAGGLHRWDGADTDLAIPGDLYAIAPDAYAWAVTGDASLAVLDRYGLSTVAAGGALSAVGAGPDDNWMVGTSSPAQLRETGVADRLLAFTPEQVGTADFDGDGLVDRWAFGGGYFYHWTRAGEEGVTGLDGFRVVTSDLDGDGCSDLVSIASDGTLHIARVADCSVVDNDADGTPDPLDCNDEDAAIHPGAVEACDGVDQDCDGIADESDGVDIVTETSPVEGVQFTLHAGLDGCDPGEATAFVWSFTGDAACSPAEGAAVCVALDNTEVVASVSIDLADGSSVSGTQNIPVANVAPRIDLTATDWGDHTEALSSVLELDIDEEITVQLVVDDVAADTVTFSEASSDSGITMSVTPDGIWTVSADPGTDGVVILELLDDDGGIGQASFFISTPDLPEDTAYTDTGGFGRSPTDCVAPDLSCGGLCCGGGLFMLSVLARRLTRG